MSANPDLTADLRTLLAIAREGSLAGAARHLRVNHSTVFRRLGTIEARRDAGQVVELRCTYDPETAGGKAPDGRKVKGTIHWVSAEHAVDASAVPVDVNETTVIRLTLAKPLAPKQQLRLDRIYAEETAVKADGKPASFELNVDNPDQVESAKLIIGIHRRGGVTHRAHRRRLRHRPDGVL